MYLQRVGRPKKTAGALDANLNLRVDARVKAALERVTAVWDQKARAMGARATEAGVVRALILREAEALGVADESPAPPDAVSAKGSDIPPKATKRTKTKRGG